jgi:predicted DNA-binding transcriptional regulator AlpA
MLIKAPEFAKMLDMSERTLWRLLSKGELPPPVRLGGSVRWRFEEVRLWIDRGCPLPGNDQK